MAKQQLFVPRLWWIWLVVQLVVVSWDASYVLLRPRSQPGGDLQWIFPGYDIYQDVDYVYKDMNNAFGYGQTYSNLIEQFFYVLGLYYYVVVGNRDLGFFIWTIDLVATLSKTVLYALVEVGASFRNTAHNGTFDFVFFYVVMNGWWIWIPAIFLFGSFLPKIYQRIKQQSPKTKTN